MNTNTRWPLGLMALAIAFASAACADSLAPTWPNDLEPSFARGGGGPGGNASGASSGPVITTLANAPGDGILSDGLGAYVPIKKKQEVESEITLDGQHVLAVNPGLENRALCVGFPPAGPDAVIVSEADWDELTSGGQVSLGATWCGQARWHSRDHQHAGKFLDMDVTPGADPDDIQTSGGKIVLEGLTGDWEWRLFFDDGRTPVNGGDPFNGLCIRYDDDGTWTAGADPTIDATSEFPGTCDAVDDWLNLIRVTPGDGAAVYTYVARFRMPFRFTVTPR